MGVKLVSWRVGKGVWGRGRRGEEGVSTKSKEDECVLNLEFMSRSCVPLGWLLVPAGVHDAVHIIGASRRLFKAIPTRDLCPNLSTRTQSSRGKGGGARWQV